MAEFKEIWRYRDWVTKAFNDDLPYTDFIKLQLAGDLLQPADRDRFNADGLVATGMLAISQFDPGSMKPQLHADSVDDLVDVVSRSFLGLTLSCARCHDHKFDPLTVEDYYGLAGIFANIKTTASLAMDPQRIIVPLATPAEVERDEKQRKDIAELDKQIKQLQQQVKAKSKDSPAELQAKIAAATKQLEELRKQKLPVLPKAVVVKEGGHADTLFKTFHDAPIHLRGDPLKLGKMVPRGFPKVLGGGQGSPGERPARIGGVADAARPSADARASWSTASGSITWGRASSVRRTTSVKRGEAPTHPGTTRFSRRSLRALAAGRSRRCTA